MLHALWVVFLFGNAHGLIQRSAASVADTSTAGTGLSAAVTASTALLDALTQDLAHLRHVLPGGSNSLIQFDSDVVSAPSDAKSKHLDPTAAVSQMAKLSSSVVASAQMPMMLKLLTGMYDTWKDKIGQANKHEQQQKKAFDQQIKELEDKKKQAHGNSEAIATYDRIEKYWKKQRSIAHRQYHTALKIMHSGMQKFKATSTAMEHAIAGKKPTSADLQVVGSMAPPDVVLVQVKDLAVWVKDASDSLHRVRTLASEASDAS